MTRSTWKRPVERVVIVKGKVRYYYNVESSNGQILATSQKYWSKSNARRAAKKVAKTLGAELVEPK